jgi:hypothetical protein
MYAPAIGTGGAPAAEAGVFPGQDAGGSMKKINGMKARRKQYGSECIRETDDRLSEIHGG